MRHQIEIAHSRSVLAFGNVEWQGMVKVVLAGDSVLVAVYPIQPKLCAAYCARVIYSTSNEVNSLEVKHLDWFVPHQRYEAQDFSKT